MLQILDPVIDHFDLLLDDRDLLRKSIVQPNFPGQLLNLGIRNRLTRFQLGLQAAVSADIGDDHAQKRQGSGDHRGNNAAHYATPSSVEKVCAPAMPSTSRPLER